VRELSKDLTSLLADEARLRAARAGRRTSGDEFRGSGSQQALNSGSRGYYNEEDELQRALEESKRTAAVEAKTRREDTAT
jgi:hypothetical protein